MTAFTVGVKLTVIVKVTGAPVHPFAEGVAVIVEVIGLEVVFVAVNEAMFPLPLAAKPVAVLSFVQETEPEGVVVKLTADVV